MTTTRRSPRWRWWVGAIIVVVVLGGVNYFGRILLESLFFL